MNKVILTGRLTREPESRMTSGNMEISRFSVACQGDFVNKNGERDVEFINCVAFNRTATTINKFCHKGSLIGITGRIRNSSYDAQDGTKRYTTDVVVDQFEFLGARQGGGETTNAAVEAYSPAETPSTPDIETTDIGEDPYADFGNEISLSSDELPF